MRVKIITPGFRFVLPAPVPLSFGKVIIKGIPQSVFDKMRSEMPSGFEWMASKDIVLYMYTECISVLQEHKGLEIVHVEADDGTYISIKL